MLRLHLLHLGERPVPLVNSPFAAELPKQPLDLLRIPARRKRLKRQTVGLLLRYPRLSHPQEPRNPPGRVVPDISGTVPHGNERLYGFGKLGSGIPEPPPPTGLSPIRASLSTKGPMTLRHGERHDGGQKLGLVIETQTTRSSLRLRVTRLTAAGGDYGGNNVTAQCQKLVESDVPAGDQGAEFREAQQKLRHPLGRDAGDFDRLITNCYGLGQRCDVEKSNHFSVSPCQAAAITAAVAADVAVVDPAALVAVTATLRASPTSAVTGV